MYMCICMYMCMGMYMCMCMYTMFGLSLISVVYLELFQEGGRRWGQIVNSDKVRLGGKLFSVN